MLGLKKMLGGQDDSAGVGKVISEKAKANATSFVCYSERRASTGSTEAARRAGTVTAISVTSMRALIGDGERDKGSVALVWKSRLLIRRAPAKPARRPAMIPTAVKRGCLTEDESQDVAAICADSHANADFAGALGDGVGEHAEGSDGGEQRG